MGHNWLLDDVLDARSQGWITKLGIMCKGDRMVALGESGDYVSVGEDLRKE